jgi:glycosyltransferase involved in cell wall biosynthesis
MSNSTRIVKTVAISVIVPVYNVEKYIRRCLDSIQSQTFTDWECICIDDGTPDNSGKICDEYAEKDTRFVVLHKENGGVSSARNAGLDVAKGEYITFCDSDDYVEENWLFEQYKDITSGDFDVCVCGFYGKGVTQHKILNRITAKISTFTEKGIGGYSFLRLVRRRNVENIRYDTSICLLEDSDFFYRLFDKCNKILWTNKPLYHYEENIDSIIRTLLISKKAYTGVETLDRLFENEKNRKLKKLLNYRRKTTRYFLCLNHVIGNGSKDDFLYKRCLIVLKENFLSLFFDCRFGIKYKICLFVICFFRNPEKTIVLKYIRKKRDRRHAGKE